MATPGRPPAYSRTVTTELVMPQHSAPDGLCLAGVVFKWIDMCAVMCAEKHAATPCVTVGIDDVRLLTEARVGEVVRLEAVVAAVWKSSMAIEVCVDVENPMAGTVARLCNCHTTFVVKPDATGKKPSLPPLQLETDADRARQVHAERRKAYRMQIRPREDKTPLPLGLQHAPLGASPRGGKTPGASQCLSTHLVMPPDANHNGTTFGGCIMAWAGEAAYIAASRHCRTAVACESLDAVKASANRAWETSLEVGVRVESEDRTGKREQITKLFFTYASEAGATPFPRVTPETELEGQRYVRAEHRRAVRIGRKALDTPPPTGLRWEALTAGQACALLNELESLSRLSVHWDSVRDDAEAEGVRFVGREGVVHHCFAFHMAVRSAPEDAHAYVADYARRCEWDLLFQRADVVAETEKAQLVHFEMRNGTDACIARVLAVDASGGVCLNASRSVIAAEVPERDGCRRFDVSTSGFCIRRGEGGGTVVTGVHQLAGAGMDMVYRDFAVASSSQLFQSMINLKKRLDHLDPVPAACDTVTL